MNSYALDGISLADLQSQLSATQTALLQLGSGQKVVTVSYAQGNGSKSVTYSQASMANIRATIMELQAAIDRLQGGSGRVRRPTRPFF